METSLPQAESVMLKLEAKYKEKLELNPDLNRKLVSFQSSKKLPVSRWFKYKEGFSADLVEYCLRDTGVSSGSIFDPFAGSGTSLFTANKLGLDSLGVEILPIAHEIIEVQHAVLSGNPKKLAKDLEDVLTSKPWTLIPKSKDLPPILELPITKGAYPQATELEMQKYAKAISTLSPLTQRILRFALLCVLESISFTRKDGQFLRWDYRSGRSRSKSATGFDKGKILDFNEAIESKIAEMIEDLESAESWDTSKKLQLINGSILRTGNSIPLLSQAALVTSPPYLNRYDYTRTYALELAYLGVSEDAIKDLRQELLSATVENRQKDLVGLDQAFVAAAKTLDKIPAYTVARDYLKTIAEKGELNNSGIVRMFEGYFLELSAVIWHSSKILSVNAPFIMVNDNVRYGGLSIPVDLILSEVAGAFGLETEKIWVLPTNKGNSSQQMGNHGRLTLRKCVYVWRKAS
jgi:DNA modification methylase